MLVNRKFDALASLLVIVFLGFALLQPGYRLQVEPPPEFILEAPARPPKKRTAEERIARAYWKCAATDIQWRYGYAHRLPLSPPPEFALSPQDFGSAAVDLETRARYWKKLQQVWYMPGIWRKGYEGNFRSLGNSLRAAGDWLSEHILTNRP